MSMLSFPLIVGCLFLLLPGLAAAESALWLSDAAPHGGHGGRHSHGGPVQVRKGVYYKQLWLRQGDTPRDDGYVVQGSRFSPLVLIDAAGGISEHKLRKDKEHGLLNVQFAMPEEGFYNAYLTHQWVEGDQREMQIAKAEVLKHSCREGHDDVQPKMPPRNNSAIPLEIVRERIPKENFHSRIGFGESVSFLVLHNGMPQPDAEVTFFTAEGWNRRAVSDANGKVSFTLVRDYYPPWRLFDKRHSQPYMVKAEYRLPEAGELDGLSYASTLYRASFSGSYFPSERSYQSYAYGLGIGLFALVGSGVGIYGYRRRRRRPYREVNFDE